MKIVSQVLLFVYLASIVMAQTPAPTTSPTASPTGSPTKSPTASPSASPTESPTASPSASPTTSPTASPTRSPTVSSESVTDVLKFNADTTCGSTSLSSSTEAHIYDCIKKCDDTSGCGKSSFNTTNGECKLFSDTGNTNAELDGVVCVEKEFHAPDRNYHDDDAEEHTEYTQCSDAGDEYLAGMGLSELTASDYSFTECVSFCNSFYGCTGFDHTNGTHCKFYSGVNITIGNYTGAGTKKCYIKDDQLYGSFFKHIDFDCGSDLLSTTTGTDGYKQTKCYDLCSVNPECGGFEYIDGTDTCFLFNTVESMANVTGKDCYRRTDGLNDVIGRHTVRLIFTEGVWNNTVHLFSNFSDYLEDILDDVLNKDIAGLSAAQGAHGITIDFSVDDIHATPLEREDIYHILAKTQANSDPYKLGNQLIGDYSLPPPTAAPTQSPSASPTASPTTAAPSASPTRAPTLPASEIVHLFTIVEDHVCGPAGLNNKNVTVTNVWECMGKCDNYNTCHEATFDPTNGECLLFSSNSVLHAAETGKHCLVQSYAGPHHSYSKTADAKCVGPVLLSNKFSDQTLENADWSDCAYVCNNWLECEGFNHDVSETSCTFFKSVDSSAVETGTDCNEKDWHMTGTYAGHENMGCGIDVRGQTENVPNSIHSCIDDCDADSLCVGWEYYEGPKTCIRYASISLYGTTGKTCYSRSFITGTFLDKHLGRIRFVDAVWNATLHESAEFKDYMEGVLEHVLQKNVTILFIVEGSVIVEYTVTTEHDTALSGQELALIKDKIVADGIHDLGVNLIGGSDPPPPTARPTESPTTATPTTAPTSAPTDSPTTPVPTDAPTTTPPTTAAPTTAAPGIFEGHHTVEIVVFTMIGVAGAILLYVLVKFLFIWSRGGADVISYDDFNP